MSDLLRRSRTSVMRFVPSEFVERRWWTVTALLVAAWTALLGFGVVAGRSGNLGGDASVRLVSANFCATDAGGCVAPLLDGPWPPGQTLVLAPALLFGGAVGASPPMTGSLLALAFFAASAWLTGRLAAGLAGELAGLLAVSILLTLQVVMNWSTNTYGEMFALAPLLGALCVFDRWTGSETRSASVSAVLVGTLLLCASMIRTEIVVIAGALSVIAWFRDERREAVVISSIAGSYTVVGALLGRGGRGLAYSEIGEWYGFSSGRAALPEITDTLVGVMVRPHWLFGVLVVVAVVWLSVRQREQSLVVPVFVAITAFNVALAFFGFVKSADRYYMTTAVLGAVLVAQLAGTALQAVTNARLAAATGCAMCLVLAFVAWSTHRDVELRYQRFVDAQAQEMNGWLLANVGPDETVFFDFIRFYAIYFRSHLDQPGQARDHFDYTSYYSGLPERQPVRQPVAEVSRNVQIRRFGHERLRSTCPNLVVVSSGPLLDRVVLEQPELLMITPFLSELADGVMIYQDPATSDEIKLTLAHDNGKFAAYRTDCAAS